MCEFCEKSKTMMSDEFVSTFSWGWGIDRNGDPLKISQDEASVVNVGVFIDRGHIRMVDSDESQCMDNGNKIKIKFCPFCGEKIEESC